MQQFGKEQQTEENSETQTINPFTASFYYTSHPKQLQQGAANNNNSGNNFSKSAILFDYMSISS